MMIKKFSLLIVQFFIVAVMFSQEYNVDSSLQDMDVIFDDIQKTLNNKDKKDAISRFKGHWMGVEIGLNNYLSAENKSNMLDADRFMTLDGKKSWAVNLNFIQYSQGIIKDQVGLVTGLGFEFNNYQFEHNNSITINDADQVREKIYPDSKVVIKSKLNTSYVTLPLMIEGQFAGIKRNKRIYIAAGVIGGYKIGSHTKVVAMSEGEKIKEKEREEYNLSKLRYGFVTKIGYQFINLVGSYYFTPFFESQENPELYPVMVGLHFGI